MINIHFILNVTILLLYIIFILIAVKVIKDTKVFKQKLHYENNMYSNKTKIKNKYNNFSFMLLGANFALVLSALFNIVLESNRTFIIMILIMISALIDQYLYAIFSKKREINSNGYKYMQKTIYWSFAMVDIGFLLILTSIE